jgi:hypothetical protein
MKKCGTTQISMDKYGLRVQDIAQELCHSSGHFIETLCEDYAGTGGRQGKNEQLDTQYRPEHDSSDVCTVLCNVVLS